MTKSAIAIGKEGYIDASEHRQALAEPGTISPRAVVRFYFGPYTWMDIKFEKDAYGKPCLQVRAMCDKIPSLAVQPESGNTILIVPGG